MSRGSQGARYALCVLLLLIVSGCRQKMANQPRYDPLEASDLFKDGMASRPRIEGVVARGELVTDPFLATGKINGAVADGFPFAVTASTLDRGQTRYNIYCSPCHSRLGDGNGMIPSRGYRRPPSFHTETLRTATTGHYFDVITNGFGAMPPYGPMIPPEDRWAIVAYIRALQLSQSVPVNAISPADRAKLDAPPPAAATHEGAEAHGESH
jgi:mono/diheme cytochrome c family protein